MAGPTAALWVSAALLLPLLFVFLFLWQWRSPRVYWMVRGVPSQSKVPIVGDIIRFAGRTSAEIMDEFIQLQKAELIGNKVRALCIGIPSVMLLHPDEIEVVLASSVNIKKGYEYFALKPWLREGLLMSDGNKWKQRRKLLTPTFHFQILEDNVGQVSQHSKTFIQKLLKSDGKPVALSDMVKKYTLDVICETAMGIKMNAQENESESYVTAIKRASEVVMTRCLKLWLMRDWLFNLTTLGKDFNQDVDTLHHFTEKVIAERKKERSKDTEKTQQNRKRKAFLDMLLDTDEVNGGIFSALDIREEVDTFMFEGHDTTSSAINFAIYALANNPEIQEQVFEEQQNIFGSEEREPTMQDLQEMRYLEMVIKEVLRLYPPVPFISRTLVQDTKLGDTTLAAGTNIAIVTFLLHRRADYWEDPEEFRPERFLPGTSRHPFSYLPFSAGPRNCIGMKFAMMELKTTLSSLVRSCHIDPVTTNVKTEPMVILRPAEPIQVRITPRKVTIS